MTHLPSFFQVSYCLMTHLPFISSFLSFNDTSSLFFSSFLLFYDTSALFLSSFLLFYDTSALFFSSFLFFYDTPLLFFRSQCPSLSPDVIPSQSAGEVFQQLLSLGYLDLPMDERKKDRSASLRESELVYGDTPVHAIVAFAKKVLSAKLLEVGSCLYAIHGEIYHPDFHKNTLK